MMKSLVWRTLDDTKIIWGLMGLILLSGCARIPTASITTQKGTVLKVEVEVARKPEERNLGLMFRKTLGKDRGMLFIFEEEKKQTFTMKNTFIPLDMIFIDRDMRIAGWVENAKPHSQEQFSIARPAQYVLEVNAFFCRDRGIAVGDEVAFRNID
jgi:uncharacterized protein